MRGYICVHWPPGCRMDGDAATRPRGAADTQAAGERMKPLPADRIEGKPA